MKKPKSKQKANKIQKEKNPPDHTKVEYVVNGVRKLPPYHASGYNDKGQKIADPSSKRQLRINAEKAKGPPPAPPPEKAHPKVYPRPQAVKETFFALLS